MTDKLISALTTASSAANTDDLVLNQDAGGGNYNTKRITLSALKASLFASAALTGTPTVPTAGQTVSNTQAASTAYVNSAIGFIANRNGTNQTGLTAGAGNKIAFNNIIRNDGGYYDGVTNYRFTPPAGVYRVTLCCAIGTGTSNESGQALIYKNGSSAGESLYLSAGALAGSAGPRLLTCADVVMNGTDYLEGFVYAPLGVTVMPGGTAITYFSAFKIRD